MIPIHFIKEGYTKAVIHVEDMQDYVSASARFDERYDWIVRAKFIAHVPATEKKIQKLRYSLYAEAPFKTDLVNTGHIFIAPAVREDVPNATPTS